MELQYARNPERNSELCMRMLKIIYQRDSIREWKIEIGFIRQ